MLFFHFKPIPHIDPTLSASMMDKKDVFGTAAPLVNLSLSFEEEVEQAMLREFSPEEILLICDQSKTCGFWSRELLSLWFSNILPEEPSAPFLVKCDGCCHYCGIFSDCKPAAKIVFY